MFKYELSKLYKKQYFLLLVALFVVLKFISFSLVGNDDKNIGIMSKNDEIYAITLLTKLQGKLDSEKESLLKEEINNLYSAKTSREQMYDDLFNGKYLSLNTFSNRCKEFTEIMQKEKAIAYVNNIFLYANQDREHRWILSENLITLENDSIDFLLLIFVLISSICIYYQEENSNMLDILRTNESRMLVSKAKVWLLSLTVICICIIFMVIDFAYILSRINFNEIFAPVQSLKFYANSNYYISILDAMLITWLLKIVGFLFIAFLSVLILNTTKNPVIPIFGCLLVYIIEPFLFTKNVIYYTPFSLCKAVGFIRGMGTSIIGAGMYTEEVLVDFNEISLEHTLIVLLLTIVITITMIVICYNHYSIIKKTKSINLKRKGLCVGLLIVITVFMLTSCNKIDNNASICINMNALNAIAQNNENYFYKEKNNIIMVNKKDGKKVEILRNAFLGDKDIAKIYNFSCTDKYLYYIISVSTTEDIYRINLKNFSEEHILSTDLATGESFLGLGYKDISYGFSNNIMKFFVVNDSKIYVMSKDTNYLFCYNIADKSTEIVIDDGIYNDNLCCNGDMIYYINSFYELKRFDIATKENVKIVDECYRSIYLYDDKLYATNLSGIYSIDIVNYNTSFISQIKTEKLACDGKNILYLDENRNLFILRYNKEKQLLVDEAINKYEIINDTNSVFINYNSDDGYNMQVIYY